MPTARALTGFCVDPVLIDEHNAILLGKAHSRLGSKPSRAQSSGSASGLMLAAGSMTDASAAIGSTGSTGVTLTGSSLALNSITSLMLRMSRIGLRARESGSWGIVALIEPGLS